MTYSAHLIYGYMTLDIWWRTTQKYDATSWTTLQLAAKDLSKIVHTTAFVNDVEHWLEW